MRRPIAQGTLSLYPLDPRCALLTNWLWTPDQDGVPSLERQHLWVRFPKPIGCTGIKATFGLPIGQVVVETAENEGGKHWRTLASADMERSPCKLTWSPAAVDNIRIRIVRPSAPRFPLGNTFTTLDLVGCASEIQNLEGAAPVVPSIPLENVSPATTLRFAGLPGRHRNERLGLCHEPADSDRLERIDSPTETRYKSRLLQIGFSRQHARLTHLGWDANGTSRANANLLVTGNSRGAYPVVMRDGLRLSSEACSGELSVQGQRVCYRGIRPVPELHLDYAYTVSEQTVSLCIDWRCDRSFVSGEIAALRLPFDLYQTVSGVLAMPDTTGPSGLVTLPAVINAPNHGSVRLTATSNTDNHSLYARLTALRSHGELWFDLLPGVRPLANGQLEMPAGRGSVTYTFELTRIFPGANRDQSNYFGWWQHPPNYSFAERDNVLGGLPHAWLNGLSFRPDLGRFANNAVADSAAGCASYYAEIAAYSPLLARDLDPRQLLRFATEQLLRDKSSSAAYSNWRHCAMAASAPIDCAWLYLASSGDWSWGESWQSALIHYCKCLLALEFDGSGLVSSVYSGVPEQDGYMSCSWCDSLRSGHLESYVNSHVYRALLRAGDMLERLDQKATCAACRSMASRLYTSFVPTFVDDARQEIVQWVARDGRCFSFDSHMHLGAAITCGLVPEPLAHLLVEAYLRRLEAWGCRSYSLGLPIVLRPVPRACHNGWMGQGIEPDGRDQLGIYMNGALHTHQMYYLLQAMYQTGLRTQANAIISDLTPSVRQGLLCGGLHSGLDWRHPATGEPSGYEGLLAEQFHFLLAGITGYLGCQLTLDGLYIAPWAGDRAKELLPHIHRAPNPGA